MLSGPELEGKYEILRKIREGGMGAVYEVRHRLLDERRVIKVIQPHLVASAELAERFRREARAASGLRHPNIAQLHDFSVDADGRAYIIMELIEGLGLDEILRTQGPPPLGLGLEISRQSLRAIGFLHRRGFLHRDVSPDNLMLTRDPEGAPLVKLIDLGIAKVLVEEGGQGLTMTGTFLGKPRYASPEQLGTGNEIDGRSDLYSLGIVIYELLTGVCPIQGDNPSALLASHLFHPPLDFSVSDPAGKLPADLRGHLLKALAKKPEERFTGAGEMRERLTEVQERFPWTLEDLDEVLARHRPQDLEASAGRPRRGSTQERLDRQFVKQETPPAPVVPTERLESRPVPRTEPIPVAPPAPAPALQPAEEPVLAVTPAWRLPPEALRGKGWIAAAVALLVLTGLAALFLGRPDDAEVARSVEEKEHQPAAEEAVPPQGPIREPVTVPAPPAEQPEPPPVEIARVVPAPAVAKPQPKPVVKTAEPEAAEAARPGTEKKIDVPVAAERDRSTGRQVAPEEETTFVEPPRPLSMPAASYPQGAAGSGAKARVVVSVLVDEKGEVAEARVASITIEEGKKGPTGDELKSLFREAALAAARRTRFEPATSAGVPVPLSGIELLYEFQEVAENQRPGGTANPPGRRLRGGSGVRKSDGVKNLDGRQEILTTFFAWRPLGPSTTSNETRSPSPRVRKPSAMIDEWCTNTSAPRSRTMNPYPFASLNHFTIPCSAILCSLLQ